MTRCSNSLHIPKNSIERWISVKYVPDLVSVIIPTYNRGHIIRETLDSVFEQTYRPIEMIVIDDGSNDNTSEIIEQWATKCADDNEFKLHYFYQENMGANVARNLGLIESCGEHIQFLDSDDLLHPKKFEIQLGIFAQDKKIDFVWSGTGVFHDLPSYDCEPDFGETDSNSLTAFLNKPLWHISSGIYVRSAVARIGPWNEMLPRWQDWEYNIRFICSKPYMKYISGVYSLFRVHNYGRINGLWDKLEGVLGGLAALDTVDNTLTQYGIKTEANKHVLAKRYFALGRGALRHGAIEQTEEAFTTAEKYTDSKLIKIRIKFARYMCSVFGFEKATFLLHLLETPFRCGKKIYSSSRKRVEPF